MTALKTFNEVLTGSEENAVILPHTTPPLHVTYTDLLKQISHLQTLFLANPIVAQLPPQSAISMSLGNSLEFTVAFLATVCATHIAAPLNPNYKKEEFDFYISDLRSQVVFVPRGSPDSAPIVQSAKSNNATIVELWYDPATHLVEYQLLNQPQTCSKIPENITPQTVACPLGFGSPQPRRLAIPSPDDVALVLHTSGTTGRPKAVPLTHGNVTRTMHNVANTYKLSASDKSYLVMPLFHVHGLVAGMLAVFATHGTVILPPKFSAHKFWQEFAQFGATWYTAVPTIHHVLLRSPAPNPVPYIRFIRSCSSPLAPATLHQLESRFKAPVLEAYAMTEAAHQMTSNNLPPGIRKPGTVGVGQGVEITVLDDHNNALPVGTEGEIAVRGANVTKGYLNNPKANAEAFTPNGFFRTGDQGKLDSDGFLTITGRIKELINRGGEKISPVELDAAMLQHPAVSEAVSFAVPDEKYGQVVNAAVVLKQGAEVTEAELQKFLKEKVADFKVPEKIFFTDVMPKTATGKIQRRMMVDKFVTPKAKL